MTLLLITGCMSSGPSRISAEPIRITIGGITVRSATLSINNYTTYSQSGESAGYVEYPTTSVYPNASLTINFSRRVDVNPNMLTGGTFLQCGDTQITPIVRHGLRQDTEWIFSNPIPPVAECQLVIGETTTVIPTGIVREVVRVNGTIVEPDSLIPDTITISDLTIEFNDERYVVPPSHITLQSVHSNIIVRGATDYTADSPSVICNNASARVSTVSNLPGAFVVNIDTSSRRPEPGESVCIIGNKELIAVLYW